MKDKPNSSTMTTPSIAQVRLDIWLWATRFFKTRSVAKHAIESGKVRIDDREVRASSAIRVGQSITIVRGEERFEISVVGLPERRGSAAVAAGHYVETPASIAARKMASEQRKMSRDGYEKPPTKPDKRARRLIKALGDIDMF